MWPVLQHALTEIEQQDGVHYDLLLLLDPTSPAREAADVSGAFLSLAQSPEAYGVIGVSQPEFNPLWNCVVERDGWMADLFDGGGSYSRRQELPTVYRINGSLYLWRTDFLRTEQGPWRLSGNHLMYEIPEYRAMSFDTELEFQRAELLVSGGLITLPWLQITEGLEGIAGLKSTEAAGRGLFSAGDNNAGR